MRLIPAWGQPEARLGEYEEGFGSGRLALTSEAAVDQLIELASALVATCPSDDKYIDVEVAMDYLCERGEFMRLLEYDVECDLGRPSTGAEDAPFELRMVELMTAVQLHLQSASPITASAG